ncbi:hypothetical protein AAEH72_17875 [Shewanella xiamenensis]|uniref:hypothetical protein n=1 Tax=Shewanella TaxID=22 RepID=UPI00193D10D5|nr:hypothetical protein [Shewanella sp. LZH-2]QRK80589.1 hypothetical protein JM642_05640 [Shewanella sp. LZH-2]
MGGSIYLVAGSLFGDGTFEEGSLVDSSVAESSVVEGVVWEVMQISFQERESTQVQDA